MKPGERVTRLERALEAAAPAPTYDEQAAIAQLRAMGEAVGGRWPDAGIPTARRAWDWLMNTIRSQGSEGSEDERG